MAEKWLEAPYIIISIASFITLITLFVAKKVLISAKLMEAHHSILK
jgi:hypothetical protein